MAASSGKKMPFSGDEGPWYKSRRNRFYLCLSLPLVFIWAALAWFYYGGPLMYPDFPEVATPNSATIAAGPDIRMNHIQVVGTHNSYHREISLAERPAFEAMVHNAQNLYYSHSKWADQLSHQGVRSLEIDLHSDTKGGLYANPLVWQRAGINNTTAQPWSDANMYRPGLKVFHVTDADTNSICHTFVECLKQLKEWSDDHPTHVPILIDLELKCDTPYCDQGGVCAEEARTWTTDRVLEVDREIRSVLPSDKLVTPDDLRQPNMTLEESILANGWPKLDDVRGRFMFYFDNDPFNITACSKIRHLYTTDGHESLQDRAVFTNSLEGSPDGAFIKYNNPSGVGVEEIQRLVKKGYIVRTRADEPIDTVLNKDLSWYDASWPSGAQIVSTDWPAYGMAARYDWDYAVRLPGNKVAICNPVNAPEGCEDNALESA